ncbi:MAG: phage tail sheath family protein [Synergistaceae bacterium]|nr:phage tail sheath family protein [Synergistaceae bacterium]
MAFQHGVYKQEIPTSLIPVVQMESGLPVIVGTAPIYLVNNESNVNRVKLVYSYAEAVTEFGFDSDWEKYTLSEFIYSQFALYGMAPAVLINVFDPEVHKEVIAPSSYTVTSQKINLGKEVIISAGITFSGLEESHADPVKGTDYTLSYDSNNNAILSIITGGKLDGLASLTIGFTKAKPELVTSSDIIGGVDVQTGDYKGLELINSVFPKFRIVPGLIGSPKFSENSGVAAVMRAKADNINGCFTCCSVIDIPSDNITGAAKYSDVPEWKNQHNYMAERQIVCWPKVKLGDYVFHMSTQLIGVMNKTDKERDDIPYKSPSNEMFQMDACINAQGDEINLGLEQGNYLNSQGIVTAINWVGGWRAWGNRTAAYPASTDVKDVFIPVRRMFDFLGNQFILTFWQKVDEPLTVRLIRTIINSFDIYLNSLQARDMILGGRVEFLEDENSITDLMDGTLRLHVYVTPPSPAEVIEGIFEYDPDYIKTLFEAVR